MAAAATTGRDAAQEQARAGGCGRRHQEVEVSWSEVVLVRVVEMDRYLLMDTQRPTITTERPALVQCLKGRRRREHSFFHRSTSDTPVVNILEAGKLFHAVFGLSNSAADRGSSAAIGHCKLSDSEMQNANLQHPPTTAVKQRQHLLNESPYP